MSVQRRVVSLIGMPGGGKSTVGKLLARRLDLAFFDVDAVIEGQCGCSIAEVFQQRGEEAFREVESEVLARIVNQELPSVVATGGGSVLMARNRDLLRTGTVPVYLHATLAELWRRVRRNSRRPLLQVSDPYARLQDMLAARHPLYCEVAKITVETGEPSMAAVVDDIMLRLRSMEQST